MKKFFFIVLVSLSLGHALKAQVPHHISRTSNPSSSTLIDAAQKSITLLPNFTFTAEAGKYYEATITGILPDVAGTVSIEWPKQGQIYQRNNSNQGWVYVKGSVSDNSLSSVKIEANPIQGGTYSEKVVPVSGGVFEGAILLNGGDYNLVVREHMVGSEIKTNKGNSSVNRVGVGEVIMLIGHSFMEGGQPSSDEEEKISNAANDERVRTVPSIMFDPAYNNAYFTNIPALPFIYHKIVNNVGPMVSNSWIYGALGDTLVNRLGVPVLIYSSAFGGSAINYHVKNINEITFPWFPNFSENRFPHRGVVATTDHYIPKTGLRTIIFHHGINDLNTDLPSEFTGNINFVFNDIKTRLGNYTNLSVVLARDMAMANEINTQIDALISGNTYYYPGIDLRDPSTNGPWRKNEYGCEGCGHFKNDMNGLTKYLEFWKNALPNSLFTSNSYLEANIPSHLKN